MNYKKIHDRIITRAKSRKLTGYLEKHHVVPKCLGGKDIKENIVKLTAKEHYVVHRLLVRVYPEEYKLVYALWAMTLRSKHTKERIKFSSRVYEQSKLNMSKAVKKRLSEHNPWRGKKHSEESKKRMSESAKNRNISTEMENQRCDNIRKSMRGKTKSKEHSKNISKSKLGKNNPMYGMKWKLIEGKRVYYKKEDAGN